MEFPETFSSEKVSKLESSVVRRIQEVIKDRRSKGHVTTTGLILNSSKDYDGIHFSKKKLDLMTLILLCWYSDSFNGFESYILYEIREYLNKNLIFPELSAMTNSKELALLVFLLPCQNNSLSFLFGRVLDPSRIERVIEKVSLKWIKHRYPKRTIRHRGYRDHGTLRPDHQWVERYDLSFTEEQLLVEEQRSRYHQVVTLLVRAAGEWYIRNAEQLDILKEE